MEGIENVVKLDAADGDVLIVTLAQPFPEHVVSKITDNIEDLLDGKDVKVLIVPPGTKVELLKTSQLADKESD